MHNSPTRYNVSAWGRQSGKSTFALNKLLNQAWTNKNHIYWLIEPTYSVAGVMWRRVYNAIHKGAFLERNKGELFFRLLSGSYIFFKSGEVGENLRAETLNGLIVDEVRQQPSWLWDRVLRAMLSTTGGWADFISTPNGYDQFYDLFQLATHNTNGRWNAFHSPSTCNPLFTQEEYDAAQEEMDEAEFDQEINANFRDISKGRAYRNFSRDVHIVDSCPWKPGQWFDPALPVVLGCDFNLSPMAWNLGQLHGKTWYWFDEIWFKNSHTPEASAELVFRLKAMREMGHKAEMQLIICGDASSNSGQRAAAGKSDYDIMLNALKEAGITYSNRTPKANPRVKDRVNSVNARLKSASGTVDMFFCKGKTKYLCKDMERVTWREGSNNILDQKTDKMLTHSADGLGYPVIEMTPIKRIGDVGKLAIIEAL